MSKRLVSGLCLLVIWQLLAAVIDNEIILPSVFLVGQRFLTLLGQKDFYMHLLATFGRAHLAFLISLAVALLLALLADRYSHLEEILSPWIKSLQTIPQISFVILLLFWFKPETALLWVIFFIAFPIAYFSFSASLKAIPASYRDLLKLYPQPLFVRLRKAELPLIAPALASTIQAGLPLSLKVAVMSEVLMHTARGIGRALSSARANIDMVGVFAWTLALLLFAGLEVAALQALFKKWLSH